MISTESYFGWLFMDACGIWYTAAIVTCAVTVLIGVCLVVIRTRNLAPLASILVLTPLPMLLGVATTLHHIMGRMGGSMHVGPKTDAIYTTELLFTLAGCMAPVFVGLIVSFPAFIIAAIALFVRALRADALGEKTGHR